MSFVKIRNNLILNQSIRRMTLYIKEIIDLRISVLPVVSKFSERIMQKQINNVIITFLSPYLYGYRKGFITQHALLHLLRIGEKVWTVKDLVVQYKWIFQRPLILLKTTTSYLQGTMHMVFKMTL